MSFQHKPNTGSLFKNDRKEKDTHPDYNGVLLVGDTEYWLSGWVKEGKRGKFFSLSIKPKIERPAAPATTQKPDDSDPPF